jgi:hypothetical protein
MGKDSKGGIQNMTLGQLIQKVIQSAPDESASDIFNMYDIIMADGMQVEEVSFCPSHCDGAFIISDVKKKGL